MMQFSYDKNFLKQLFNQVNKTIYVKILSLDFLENIREEIQGYVSTAGAINIDGSSAVRRTCNLTLITENNSFNLGYWVANSKFKLLIGLQNNVDSKYESIIWFPQGTYVITSFNSSQNANSSTISISGKDKMCLLNGEVGGHFTASTELAFEEIINENNEVIKNYLLVKDIILNLIHVFGKEPLQNIIINDLEDIALELVSYQGDKPLYFLRNPKTGIVEALETNGDKVYYTKNQQEITFNTFDENNEFYSLSPYYTNDAAATQVAKQKNDNKYYQVIKVAFGDTAGYRETTLTYPAGTLEAKAGETISSVMDKIVKTFSTFEYFYDVYGRFVFQKKRTYAQSNWSPINDNLDVSILSDNQEYVYNFNNSELYTAFNNTPNLLNLKNDFTVWGTRTTVAGAKIDMHIRYAIDDKPTYYKRTDNNQEFDIITGVDWREIIYQMADDYYINNFKGNEFYSMLKQNNPNYVNGITGYEQYYTDILGFWRDLYDGKNWKKEVISNPETMSFWFDFIEGSQALKPYNVKNLGSRTKVVNDSNSTAISFRDIVKVLFVKDIVNINTKNTGGYTYVQLPSGYEKLFNITSTQKSLQNELDKLLYNHLFMTETQSITSLPIYTLEPNTKIYIQDNENNIQGSFVLNKISIPIQYNGTMSLTTVKDTEKIY